MTDTCANEARDASSLPPSPFSVGRLFLIWLRIGCTSFGGGAITQYLIQEHFIYKHRWIAAEEYARIMAMSQIVPGINILAYTILIGRRLAGWTGIVVSLAGLILPSAAITVLLSAIYAGVSGYPRVQSSLRAVFAAIFGISLATNWRNVRPIFLRNRRRGVLAFGSTLGIFIGSACLYQFLHPPVAVLYLLGGVCGASLYGYLGKKKEPEV